MLLTRNYLGSLTVCQKKGWGWDKLMARSQYLAKYNKSLCHSSFIACLRIDFDVSEFCAVINSTFCIIWEDTQTFLTLNDKDEKSRFISQDCFRWSWPACNFYHIEYLLKLWHQTALHNLIGTHSHFLFWVNTLKSKFV